MAASAYAVSMAMTSTAPSSSFLPMPGTVTAATPASPGILFAAVEGDFDFHGPPEQLLSVQLFYRPQGVLLRFHGYKTESTGISRGVVRNENGLQNGSGVGKKITHILLGSGVVQIPDIEFILHFEPGFYCFPTLCPRFEFTCSGLSRMSHKIRNERTEIEFWCGFRADSRMKLCLSCRSPWAKRDRHPAKSRIQRSPHQCRYTGAQ